jgi:uncharacterized membrane protein YfcA
MLHDIILFLVGIIIGTMNSIAGGGMLIGFPLLITLGLPPLIANATGALAVIPGQLTSAIGYHKYLAKVPWRYTLLLIPCLLGAIGGALTLRYTPAEHFARIVPLLVLFGVLLFAVQPFLHFHLHKHVTKRSRTLAPLLVLGLLLIPITFYGGYFGAGYGFLMLAFLGFTSMRDSHTISAMKNVSAVFVASASVACLSTAHMIHWRAGLIMAAGCAVGGFVGARSAQKVSTHWLRIAIIIIGVCAAAYLGFREY